MQREGPKYIGEPSIEALASGLGTLGRYGDDYMVHAAEGETVVPAEILAANPGLKHQLFMQMRMMGIKDPNRYVVGNALNSINPLTGQPEFWFKKIFRAVKKVFKKVAPIIVPIIGNMIAPGIGGPIASALLTKVQGGNWGDALKSAAMSYGAQTLGAGVKQMLSTPGGGIGDLWSGIKSGAMAPWKAAGNLFSAGSQNPLAQGIFGPRGANLIFSEGAKGIAPYTSTMDAIFPSYNPSPGTGGFTTAQGQIVGNRPVTAQEQLMQQQRLALQGPSTDITPAQDFSTGSSRVDAGYDKTLVKQLGTPAPGSAFTVDDAGSYAGTDANRWRTGSRYSPGDPPTGVRIDGSVTTGGDVTDAARPSISQSGGTGLTTDASQPGWLERNLGKDAARGLYQGIGSAAIPAAVAGIVYVMSEDEDEPNPDESQMTPPQVKAWDEYNSNRTRDDWDTWKHTDEAAAILVRAGIYGPQYSAEDVANITGVTQQQAQQSQRNLYPGLISPLGSASGGIASLQGGGEIEGPGTGTSDSIPARLSDGEFVMTAESVRNAGKGDRNLGAARMYDLMERFEGAPA